MFERFIGHDVQLRTLQLLADRADEHPPPLLICGNEGVGRRPAARLMLDTWRTADEPLFDLGDRQLVMNDKAGEKEDDRQFPVSSLRRTLARSATGNRAVLINLKGAGHEVQNALLKTFEEPPRRTWIVALAPSPAAVLPTLRSRCHRVAFPDLTITDLKALASREGWAADDGTMHRAKGSAERLQWLCDHPSVDQAVSALDMAQLATQMYEHPDRRQFVLMVVPAVAQQDPSRLIACQQAMSALHAKARPETAFALAALPAT